MLSVVALVVLCLLCGNLRADGDVRASAVEAKLRVYTDDDHVTVVSPSVAAKFSAGESLAVSVASTIDVVSAASVDVITSASPTQINEKRVEGGSTVEYSLSPTFRLRAGGVFSHENDYDTMRPTIGGQIEVAERNATIDLAYTATFDEVGNSVDPSFSRSRRGHILEAGFTQILDPRTYFDVLLDARFLKGFHASAYRKVAILDPLSSAVDRVGERTPSLRKSGAALVRIRRALGESATWFLHASYRLYGDSWSVASHTLDFSLLHAMADDRYLLGLRLRGYWQSSANFYEARYRASPSGVAPKYRTRDRTLGGMHSLHASATLDTALGKSTGTGGWRLRSMFSITQFVFSNFPAQRERRALTLSLSLVAPL